MFIFITGTPKTAQRSQNLKITQTVLTN